MNMLALLLTIS